MANGQQQPGRYPSGQTLGMDFASRLGAAQQNERAAREVDTGPSPDEPVLLELPQQSYARERTDREKELARQRQMMETQRRFLEPGPVEPAERITGAERRRPQERREAPGAPLERPQETSAIREGLRLSSELIRGKKLSTDELQRRLSSIANAAAAKNARLQKLFKNGRRIAKIIQAVTAWSFVTMITLLLQANFEVINKWTLKLKTPKWLSPSTPAIPDDDEIVAGCGNCFACIYCLIINAKIIFIVLLVVVIGGSLFSIFNDLKVIFNLIDFG